MRLSIPIIEEYLKKLAKQTVFESLLFCGIVFFHEQKFQLFQDYHALSTISYIFRNAEIS